MKNIAVVYLAHDGFTSLYTGVGTVARDFLLSFPEVSKIFKQNHNFSLDLFAVTLKYNKECFGYSDEVKNTTIQYTKKHKNIHLVELINGSDKSISYGTIENWKCACISGASFIYSLNKFNKYDKILVICVDTPFTQVAKYFFNQYSYNNIEFIWLPQSTVLIHKYDSALGKKLNNNSYVNERFLWEKCIVDLSNTNQHVKIGYIGEFMKNHLMKGYGAKKNNMISLKNGLYFNRLKKYIINQNNIAKILKKMDIPLDRQLIFSFGRAEPYKGLDLVIENSIELINQKNYFLFILASPYSKTDPYVETLNKLINNNKNMKIVYDLDFITPHYIMQWKNTHILTLLSRAEPLGMIPTESRFYNNKNLTLLTSDIDGFKEQITDGRDGFKVSLNNQDIISKFRSISNLNSKQKERISVNGYNRIIRDSDQIIINCDLIKRYL